MELTITAIFEDGVLKPTVPLDLPPGSIVRLTIEVGYDLPSDSDEAWEEFERSWDEVSFTSDRPIPSRDELHDRH